MKEQISNQDLELWLEEVTKHQFDHHEYIARLECYVLLLAVGFVLLGGAVIALFIRQAS